MVLVMLFILKKMNRIVAKYSLKTRLGLLYAVLLILSVGMVGYFSYWNIWQLFIKNETNHLRAMAKPVVAQWLTTSGLTCSDSVSTNFTRQKALILARNLTSHKAVAIVLGRNGKVMANGKQIPEEPSPPMPNSEYLHKALSGMNEVTFWSKVNGKSTLVFLIPLRPQPDSQLVFGVLQISTSLSGINKILFRYGIMQLAVAVLILILGILFGFRFIGWSLKDLNRLSAIYREIAKGNFTQRVVIRNRKDEIGQLSVAFNLMVDKLENLFRSQKRFVANATHELLTPLTGLRGSLEVLLRGAGDDPETQNQLIKGMYQEINHLIRVCDRLLDLSRLENASNVNKQPVVLSAFFSGFKQQAGHLIKTRMMRVEKGPFLTVMADSDLLEQILFNLLTNAIRHSPDNSLLTLGWKLLPDFVEIWFSDKGEGMDQETLSHVFESFFSGENKGLTEKGTGLGLTLTRLMVEAQGGTIRIESDPGKGTTVFFTLPL